MSAQTLIKQVNAAGLKLRLVDGKVKVSGHADAVALMVDQLRANKSDLIRWFTETAGNDSDQTIESTSEPGGWRGRAMAYHEHHFQCATCQAAGRGWQYGKRCEVGALLWLEYAGAEDSEVIQAARCEPQTVTTDLASSD